MSSMSTTKKNYWLRTAFAGLLWVACANAFAANPGWFGGIRMGTRSVDAPVSNLSEEPDATLNVFRFPIRLKLGMELGLSERLTSADFSGVGLRLPSDDRLGWQVLGVGSVPITKNWGVFGKLGAHRWNQDLGSNFSSIRGTDPRPTYGLGLKYDFTGNFSVSGEWDRYQLGPANGARPESDIDLLSIGLKYKF
jgi:opacity protein-like surface antigen